MVISIFIEIQGIFLIITGRTLRVLIKEKIVRNKKIPAHQITTKLIFDKLRGH